ALIFFFFFYYLPPTLFSPFPPPANPTPGWATLTSFWPVPISRLASHQSFFSPLSHHTNAHTIPRIYAAYPHTLIHSHARNQLARTVPGPVLAPISDQNPYARFTCPFIRPCFYFSSILILRLLVATAKRPPR
ncbi:hypothetical protein BDBG_17358, partial [Blastomyces gilchristii SLH14081]